MHHLAQPRPVTRRSCEVPYLLLLLRRCSPVILRASADGSLPQPPLPVYRTWQFAGFTVAVVPGHNGGHRCASIFGTKAVRC